jgi:phosphatidylserine/phosphatidylglycerophosphate/cardiolipin synthase-like enzyme
MVSLAVKLERLRLPSTVRLAVWSAAAFGFMLAAADDANAQRIRPPESGGHTASLGQPLRWRWQTGFAAGPFSEAASSDLLLRAHLGVAHDLLNPVAGLSRIAVEAYAGARGTSLDGGARAILQVPFIGVGLGADYNLPNRALDLLVTAQSPIRRGGLLTRGSMLRVDWYPDRDRSFTVGVSVPLGDPLAGRGRPLKDFVVVAADFQPRVPYHVDEPAIVASLDSLRTSADWIRRQVAPFIDQDGRDASVAVGRAERYLGELHARLSARSAEQEVRYFHSKLEQVFTLAAGRAAGSELARRAREILLEDVILPYNGLLGRKKRKDTLAELGTAARGRFSRWVVSAGMVPADRIDPVLFVFQEITLIVDDVRKAAAKEWDDSRLVWLPLQYALLPEQHDEQAELDALLEQASGVRFTNHNRIVYATNLQFHWELLRTIRETKQYHVLWIHDFPALTPSGAIDWASFAMVVDGYLTTLAERVEAYDRTGTLPTYFVFIDEHYYEDRRSRLLMTVLEDPFDAVARLPRDAANEAERLARVQDRLRAAVGNSKVLQAEARQYGEPWLRNRIKVHVNITNRADQSFWSGGLVSSIFGYPDNVMRDHRKIAFHDVNEAEPSAGLAILTGMGVGQHYLGPSWDDRSLVVQGPVLFELKRAARDLLLSQGMAEQNLPFLLRSVPPSGSAAPVDEPSEGFDARALTLVNGTGYLPKPLNAGKALLYSLLPAGSVMKIPDSLWNSTFYAALLVGACLRGATVSIVPPSLANAPGQGFPQMGRAHELMTRLLLVRRVLAEAIATAGGHLRTGLYSLEADRHGFASRADAWTHGMATTPFLREDMPFTRDLLPVVAAAGTKARGSDQVERAETAALPPPKLHQKVQFFATKEFLDAIGTSSEWPLFMRTYLRYREASYSVGGESADAMRLSTELARIAERIFAHARSTPGGLSYAIVGSQNQDYRGMFMDGEVGLLFSGPASLLPLIDLVFLEGTVTWVDDQQALDRLLPEVGELKRRLGRVVKDAL